MKDKTNLSHEELKEMIIGFYSKYAHEIEYIKDLLAIKLKELAIAYSIENKLPEDAITIMARTKTLSSTLNKLEYKKWPSFDSPIEVINDIIGARVICWYVHDCHGMAKVIGKNKDFEILKTENYIEEPKKSGYRAVHLTMNIFKNYIEGRKDIFELFPQPILCEIQIRTKLQDAWGDMTHEYYYNAKRAGVVNKEFESFFVDSSFRLSEEDKRLSEFRITHQASTVE